jgi:hypothetical protein
MRGEINVSGKEIYVENGRWTEPTQNCVRSLLVLTLDVLDVQILLPVGYKLIF